MIQNRNKLYLFLFTACIFGYVWIYYNLLKTNLDSGITACYFKNLTSLPCPSCGSTRSIISIFNGNFIQALQINPLGFLVFVIMLILPIWILFDLILKRDSFYIFYKKFEQKLRKPIFYIPLITLVIINWIWNINKAL